MVSADEPAMPAPAGDSPRVMSVAFSRPNSLAISDSRGRSPEPSRLGRFARQHVSAGVDRAELDLAVVARLDGGVRAEADGGVQRAGAGMEQVEGPDVDGAARQIDARRRGSLMTSECRDLTPGNYRIVPAWRQAHSVVRSAGSWWPGSTAFSSRSNCGRSPASSVWAASSSSRRNVAEPGQVAELSYEAARLVPDVPLWVSVDQEGGRVARLKSPFTEWPPMATLGRSGDVAPGRAVRQGAGGGAPGGRRDAGLRTGARRPHQLRQPRHRRPGAVRQGRGGRPVRRRAHPDAPGRGHRRVRQAFSRPRRHQHRLAPRAAARRAPAGAAARGGVPAVPGGRGGRRRDDHDRPRPGPVARREAPGDAVAPHRLRAAARGARLRRRHPERRSRDEGHRQRIPGAFGGRARHRGGLRRRADLQREPRPAGRGARSAGPRRGRRSAARTGASRMR